MMRSHEGSAELQIPSSRLAEASQESNDKACALCNIEG